MSIYETKLGSQILQEYFGDIVGKVGDALLKKGETTLMQIYKEVTGIPRGKIRDAIASLIQHNLVTFVTNKHGYPAYTLHHDRVLLILRFVRYMLLIREEFGKLGDEAEMVVDVLLLEGQATASNIIVNTTMKYTDTKGSDDRHVLVKNRLLMLIEKKYIQRCPAPVENADAKKKVAIPELTITDAELYLLPQELLDLKAIQNEINRRRSLDAESSDIESPAYIDDHILWKVNYDRFHVTMRDSVAKNAIECRIDKPASNCVEALLEVSYTKSDPWAASFTPVTTAEIKANVKQMEYLEQYLRILEDDSGRLVQRSGDSGGGQYRISMFAMYDTLACSLVDGIVKERFGSKAARIFRLVRDKKMIEQDQIIELSMVGKKEASILIYNMLHDNFFAMHEVRKTLTPAPPNKNIFLFTVKMNAVVRMVMELCYKGLFNIMAHREFWFLDNKRLVEKRARIDAIVSNLRNSGGTDEQLEEVEEMLSPNERQLVEQVVRTQDRLFQKETGFDETIFIFQMYLYYQNLIVPVS